MPELNMLLATRTTTGGTCRKTTPWLPPGTARLLIGAMHTRKARLAICTFKGEECNGITQRRHRWYRKAAKQGDEYSRHALATRKIGFDTLSKITLARSFLGSAFLLISSGGETRSRQRRRLALAGLLGLLWVGLDVYGHVRFGALDALSAVNAFTSARVFWAD